MKKTAFGIVLLLVSHGLLADSARTLDSFEDLKAWKPAASEDVAARLSQADGCRGKSLRLDYDFRGGSGYAVARRPLPLKLPADWSFSFCLRSSGAVNDIEVKFIDTTGDNVWWWRKKALEPSEDFHAITVKKRHVSFAWGPFQGGDLLEIAAIEIAVVAGSGGKGSLLLDELAFHEIPAFAPKEPVRVTASSSLKGSDPGLAFDGDSRTAWRSSESSGKQWLEVDLGHPREMGGVVIMHEPALAAADFSVDLSMDRKTWTAVRKVTGSTRPVSWIPFPEAEARYLRIALFESNAGRFGIREIEIRPPWFSESRNTLVFEMAKSSPRGTFPRSFLGEQTYWTVAGVDGDTGEVLLSEDGAIEPGIASFSLEPFIYYRQNLAGWSKVETAQTLVDGFIPIPSATWRASDMELSVTALVDGPRESSTLLARYRVTNKGALPARPRLFVAVRPFLVNPPQQFLNSPGGVSRINSLVWDGRTLTVDGKRRVTPLEAPVFFGAVTFDSSDITAFLEKGELPRSLSVADPTGLASGAFAWDLEIPPGASRDAVLYVPLHETGEDPAGSFEERLAAATANWREKLTRVTFTVPGKAQPLIDAVRSNLAYVLINRDGPAIQPGSRSYERSWIRDGSLTSSALLRLGHFDEVREFLRWFAGYQFSNGKIPCCVDRRGADPVPEHDSHGQFLFLAAEYLRFKNDTATIQEIWPRIEKTVRYLDSLRQQRKTPAYERPEKLAFYGLLPESISHEGYSDKPVHSYWDAFFAYKGFRDAVFMARQLGKKKLESDWALIRDSFEKDLAASVTRTITQSGISYIPGSVEKHDFDPTSTTVALSPAGAERLLPEKELRQTFARYIEEARARREGARPSDAYTPYEFRNVGALLRLGQKDEAHELLDFFMKDRRPEGWNHWAEVVASDPRFPRFLGDMPHTWVGSDFIRSVLDLFAYERESDDSLVLAAGIPETWLLGTATVGVSGMRTRHGPLSFTLSMTRAGLSARLEKISLPAGGALLVWPLAGTPSRATVNGRPAKVRGKEIVITESPAEVLAW